MRFYENFFSSEHYGEIASSSTPFYAWKTLNFSLTMDRGHSLWSYFWLSLSCTKFFGPYTKRSYLGSFYRVFAKSFASFVRGPQKANWSLIFLELRGHWKSFCRARNSCLRNSLSEVPLHVISVLVKVRAWEFSIIKIIYIEYHDIF